MCGRFINLSKNRNLKKIFNSDSILTKNLFSYNISPSQNSYIVYKKNSINIEEAKWGYSFIDKKINLKKNVINSRIETIKEKLLFQDSYLKRKCLIPLNGYYEWKIINGNRIPFFIHIPPSDPMYMAGIWKYIDFKKNDKKVFTIITKNSNEILSKVHNRMPIILSLEEGNDYINDEKSSFLNTNFFSKIEDELDFYQVSKFVNNPLNNSKECIKECTQI